ncbi:MAG: carbon starvation protein A [Armatimonadetes bacterium]|nr:carbon starvation protein A [Armatimonadota bacterium]
MGLAELAKGQGEPVGAVWILIAALCVYALGYRFYSAFIAAKVLALDDGRATPAEVHDDGKDYLPTHKWVVFGHHFAAISGPGPLIGPVLAAQLGYAPGLLWLLSGSVLGGCVQDFVILFCSIRRDGRSLGQMIKDELGAVAGFSALLGVLTIMGILLAVIGLVVVRALSDSPWGTFTIACTIPIAMIMGMYMRYWRPGAVGEATLIGVALVVAAVYFGGTVAHSPLGASFTLQPTTLAILLILYGFAASTLPVWLLLAPRDYLSTFVKIGTIGGLALGILIARPMLQMPALTEFFSTGMGPVWAGNVFPFAFITIACGAISGFHSLIASGTTPRIITKESHARLVGYGAMLMESFVGVMALLAASVLTPGVYFAMNAPALATGATPEAVVSTITGWGYPVTTAEMDVLTNQMGEKTLYHRTGGAPTLAVGMATILGKVTGGHGIDIWYHFAIMFEALFILTTLDAGTRVGRFMLQDLLGHAFPRLNDGTWWPGVLLTSGIMVGFWGYFLYAGVIDPLGGINTLWPLFGIANQMLASLALCLATVIIIKMGRARYAWVTGLPLLWLLGTTQTAAYQKVMSPSPRIGFIAQAHLMEKDLEKPDAPVREIRQKIFNCWLNVTVTVFFGAVIWVIVIASVLACWRPGRAVENEYVASRLTA